jgi:hypothetical protein
MRLVGDVVAQLHLETGAEQPTVRDCRRIVPELEDVEVALG